MPDGDNDRITLARLAEKLDNVAEDVTALRSDLARLFSNHDDRIRANEIRCAGCDPKLSSVRSDLDALKGRATLWDGVNSVAAVAAGIFGALWRQP